MENSQNTASMKLTGFRDEGPSHAARPKVLDVTPDIKNLRLATISERTRVVLLQSTTLIIFAKNCGKETKLTKISATGVAVHVGKKRNEQMHC